MKNNQNLLSDVSDKGIKMSFFAKSFDIIPTGNRQEPNTGAVTFLLESGTSPFKKIKEVQPIHTEIFCSRHTRRSTPHFARETLIYQRERPARHTRLITTCSRAFLCFVENFLKFFLKKFAIFAFQCVVITAQEKNTDFFRRQGEVAA